MKNIIKKSKNRHKMIICIVVSMISILTTGGLNTNIVFGQYPNGYGGNPMGTESHGPIGSSQGPIGSSQGPIGSSQGPIGSGESRIEISQGESAGTSYSGRSWGGAVSANEGTPGIPPGCPNPSGDNQCGEAPRQREIGQVYGSSQGWSTEAQDPNDGLSVKCYGDNTAGVATQNTPNPNPTGCQ
ncbi:MAG TPA: hypothetical protein VHJ38_04370 [Nitrososphaeraceae archaeon]|nr:hypothetical protein [Nitrososphaeraceae archaeon]